MNGESISDILKRYGTSLKETRAMMPTLTEAVRKQRLLKPPTIPRTPQFYDVREAGELGVQLDPGWMLKVTPPVDGQEPSFSYITPEKWEITQDEMFISPTGERFTRAQIERELAKPAVPVVPPVAPPEEPPTVPAPTAPLEIEQVFGRVIPERDIWEVMTWLSESEEHVDDFLTYISELGRTEDTEALLRMMFPAATDENIAELFGEEVTPPPVSEEVMASVEALRRMGATEGEIARILPEYREAWKPPDWRLERYFEPYEGRTFWGKAAATYVAGIGDLITSAGGAAMRLGYEGVGKEWLEKGKLLQRTAPPDTLGEFEWTDLLNPDFYSTKLARVVPFCLSLVPLSIAGFYGFAAVGAWAGLGTVWSWIVGALGSAALSRPVESALEAGDSYNDAIARGKTEKEAQEIFDQVFKDNLTLAGLDAFEIAVAMAPTPKWVPLALVSSKLVKTVRIGGKMVIVGLSEGGEEVYQDMIQRRARGEEWKWDPISKEVFVLGMFMGLGMGLGGDVAISIVNRAKADMPTSVKRDFDDAVSSFTDEGFTTEQAEMRALDVIAKTPEGEKVVKDAIEAVEAKEVAPEVEPAVPPEVPAVPEARTPYIERLQEYADIDRFARDMVAENRRPAEIANVEQMFNFIADYARIADPNGVISDAEVSAWASDLSRRLDAHIASMEGNETVGWLRVEKDLREISSGLKARDRATQVIALDHLITLAHTMDTTVLPQIFNTTYMMATGRIDRIRGILDAIADGKIIPKAPAVEVAPAVPVAPPGMPEAGLQPSMIPEVTGKRVFPTGKGVITQISMEEYARLQATREIPVEELMPVSRELDEVIADIRGLEETIEASKLKKLLPVWNRIQRAKDQNPALTLREYRLYTGKQRPPVESLTPDKKHVYWMDALDSVVTEYGYADTEALMTDLNKLGEANVRLQKLRGTQSFLEDQIKELEKEAARVEAVRELAKPAVPVAPAVPITKQIEMLYSDIGVEIKAAQVAVEGLTGEEARIARETLKGLERELAYVNRTLEGFKARPELPEATVLRSTIMAWAKYKGLGKTELQKIFSSVSGRRQLRVIPQEQLVEILDKVKAARPKRIRGKTVITLKTERKIQTLKDTLIGTKQLTEKSFTHLVEQLNLRATGYENQYRFITESEGKALIRAMNDEAVLAEWNIKVEEALDRQPAIKEARDRLNDRSVREREVTFDEKPIRIKRGNELRSMRYYVLKLQKELKAPIYDIWQKINMTHLAMRQKQSELYSRLEQTSPEASRIMGDEKAASRVEDYIAAKHKMAKIKSPKDITANETSIAEELERQFFDFRKDVRYARFTEAYAGHSGDIDMIARDIPDAPKKALRRAADIFEGKGAEALRTFLDTQDWGVIKTGYDPRSIIKPKLHLYPATATTFAKGHIQTRRGTAYASEDQTIFQRYRSYTKQMMGLTDLAPLIRAFDRVFTEHAPKLAPGSIREVSRVLSRGMNEMKGYREDGGFLIHALERLYAQVASAVFWRPDLVLRNKFQNFAFNPDYHAGLFVDPRNRPMSKQRKLWFEIFISQQRGIREDYLLYLQKPIAGFGRIVRMARKTSLYPWSDKSNRAEAFFVRMNKIDRALAGYEKDGDVDKLITNSGLREFEPRQQAEALELLALDSVDYGIEGLAPVTGKEAFALYNAQQLVNNVHFLYERSQRAPAEMGAAGKTLGNILVFSRSWGERFVLQANKLADPKVPVREKILALRIIVSVIVAGLLAGEAYRRITGKTHNPYNPLNILTWTPGGLIIGVAEDISNTLYWITKAVEGDERALAKLPGLLSGVATMTLPFYKNLVQAFDALTDKRNIDVLALKKVREMLDDEYEVRGGTHEVERTLLEKLQHALLAGKEKPETPQEKAADAEELLGQAIEEEDKPFSIEEPDTYDMRKLNSALGRILKDIAAEDVTKENKYSVLAGAWIEKETSEATFNTMPNMPLYKINADPKEGDTFEEYYRQWRLPAEERAEYDKAYLGNFSKRQLEQLRKLHSLDEADQADYLKEHPELKANLRDEWLKANPEDNARLALWGQAKILSMDAYNEFKKLVKELDIPDDAIPALTLPPEGSVKNYFKYLETGEDLGYNSWEVQLIIAQDNDLREFLERQPIETPVRSLELKIKHWELFDQYDALEDDEARAKLKEDNPLWVDDMRRIEAIEHDAAEDIIEQWVERGNVVDEFSAGSSEAKVWLLNNPEAFEWALAQELLTDDGSDWNEKVLRINAKWRVQDDEYDALEIGEDRLVYLAEHADYRKDRRRRDAYGEDFPENQIENYVDYYELPAKGYRQERYLIDNAAFAKSMHTIKGIDLPDPKKIPAVGWDKTYEKWQADFDKLWGMSDHESEHYIEDVRKRATERHKMRYDQFGNITGFGKAEKKLDAYALNVPEDLIGTFVEWYTSSELKRPADWEYDYWYEDDWFLKEHPRFYQTMLDLKIWLEPWDFSTVPSRKVFDLYLTYLGLPSGTPRLDFRAAHLNLDAWLVKKFGYNPISERGEEGAPKTPWEIAEEAERFKEKF